MSAESQLTTVMQQLTKLSPGDRPIIAGLSGR